MCTTCMQHTQFVWDVDVFCPVIFHWFEHRFRPRDTRPCFILFRCHQIVRKLYTCVQNITQWDPVIISTELRFLESRFICDSFISASDHVTMVSGTKAKIVTGEWISIIVIHAMASHVTRSPEAIILTLYKKTDIFRRNYINYLQFHSWCLTQNTFSCKTFSA